MRICLYSPYIPKHFGGGELYALQVLQALQTLKRTYADYADQEIFLAIPQAAQYNHHDIIDQYEAFFSVSLQAVSIIDTPLGTSAHAFKKLWWTKQWDVLYYITDGSIFPSLAKRSILHIQVPLPIEKKLLWERFKLKTWHIRNTNSEFTRNYVRSHWPIRIDYVHSPYIALPDAIAHSSLEKREKTIVHIGRFFKQLHSKRQDILLETFIQLRKNHPETMTDWQLIFIGGVEDQAYFESLQQKAAGHPVLFYNQADRATVLETLANASMYWHASGYGLDPTIEPEKMEHFGISTVEAMQAGCVPVVIAAGGQIEILDDLIAACGWISLDELSQKTLAFCTDDQHRMQIAHRARERALQYSKQRFTSILERMIRI